MPSIAYFLSSRHFAIYIDYFVYCFFINSFFHIWFSLYFFSLFYLFTLRFSLRYDITPMMLTLRHWYHCHIRCLRRRWLRTCHFHTLFNIITPLFISWLFSPLTGCLRCHYATCHDTFRYAITATIDITCCYADIDVIISPLCYAFFAIWLRLSPRHYCHYFHYYHCYSTLLILLLPSISASHWFRW